MPEPPDDRTPPESPHGLPARIDRYEIRSVIGEGAFGRVYRGFDPKLNREVAIKVPHRYHLTPDIRERFLREAREAAVIHHPNVLAVYDIGTDGDLPYVVTRYHAGGTLANLLAGRKDPPPPRFTATVVRQLARGVAAAHAKGFVHLDLKPQNAFWDGARKEVFLTGFSRPRAVNESAGVPLGTLGYMSPEQCRGHTTVIGPLSDVYALGVILYRMLTGELPFTGSVFEIMARVCEGIAPAPSVVRPEVGPALDAICLRAMAVAPDERYPSARALADALGEYIKESGRPAAPE